MGKYRIRLRRNSDGLERDVFDTFEYGDDEGLLCSWKEGVYSCDCIRALEFDKSLKPENVSCGEGAFTLVGIWDGKRRLEFIQEAKLELIG